MSKKILKFRIHYWDMAILTTLFLSLQIYIQGIDVTEKVILSFYLTPIGLAIYSYFACQIRINIEDGYLSYRNIFWITKKVSLQNITKIHIAEMYKVKFSKALYIYYKDKNTGKEKNIYFSLITIFLSVKKIIEVIKEDNPEAEINKVAKSWLDGKIIM